MIKILSGALFKALPPEFWLGCLLGAAAFAVLGGALAYVLALLRRHWKTVLLLCAVVTAVSAAAMALL